MVGIFNKHTDYIVQGVPFGNKTIYDFTVHFSEPTDRKKETFKIGMITNIIHCHKFGGTYKYCFLIII